MKKEIMAYITSTINQYSRDKEISGNEDCETEYIIGDLTDMYEFVADFKEENTDVAEVNARYVARITELEGENEKYTQRLNSAKQYGINSRRTITELGIKERELYSEIRNLKEPVSITLSMQTELQELKSQLAEAEESLTNMMDNESRLNKRVAKAELNSKIYSDATVTVVEENNAFDVEVKRLQKKCDLLQADNMKLRGPQWND